MPHFMRRFFSWLFWCTNIPFGPLAPYIVWLGFGRMPHRVYYDADGNQTDKHGNKL